MVIATILALGINAYMSNNPNSWTRGQDVFWIVRHHGIIGTLRWLKRSLPYHLWLHLTPAGRRELDFDRIHGVDTEGVVQRWGMGNPGENLKHAVQYFPTKPKKFRKLIDCLPIDCSRFTFIDIGCGKGRTLLLASEYGFARIVGVEFVAFLCEVARRNMKICECQADILCMDATKFEFPADPLVIYMCNPFDSQIMSILAGNLKRSLECCKREVYLIYWNAVWPEPFSFLRTIKRKDGEFIIFRS